MNSLNLLSGVIGQTPHKPRSRSVGDAIRTTQDIPAQPKRSASQHASAKLPAAEEGKVDRIIKKEEELHEEPAQYDAADEKTPLLVGSTEVAIDVKPSIISSRSMLRRIMNALTESVRWVLTKMLAPGVYLVSCFKDEDGRYSALAPIRSKKSKQAPKNGTRSTAHAVGLSRSNQSEEKPSAKGSKPRRRTATPQTSDSEIDSKHRKGHKATDSDVQTSADEGTPTRRSIRIKLNQDETARRRKKKQRTASDVARSGAASKEEAAAAELKSPTSPASSLRITKYPHAPAPPRPLIPRRQPSYTSYNPKLSPNLIQKTLVLDLDETLIHSLAKGGRMSSGHMVEVRLAHPVGANGLHLAPQHPILYYVHKRPHCDDFLRKISKWYNLVVFTASVQEYADPVIDWLEQERKYFSARYYRQHCTFRNGAYIKDLSSVEPDLSKVMILDNSPLSYIFHEDNAIPIEGWINDPTDNDLLHIIPLLEGLQYATDVRALLALRRGEIETAQ
ncbi:MAG: Nuclear envelope morphology protein 1 [Stictis urceolatum]|nr:Nuclear envelope morphology protein 1 [Stictis urceolata]